MPCLPHRVLALPPSTALKCTQHPTTSHRLCWGRPPPGLNQDSCSYAWWTSWSFCLTTLVVYSQHSNPSSSPVRVRWGHSSLRTLPWLPHPSEQKLKFRQWPEGPTWPGGRRLLWSHLLPRPPRWSLNAWSRTQSQTLLLLLPLPGMLFLQASACFGPFLYISAQIHSIIREHAMGPAWPFYLKEWSLLSWCAVLHELIIIQWTSSSLSSRLHPTGVQPYSTSSAFLSTDVKV